jgi:hypothetical protein
MAVTALRKRIAPSVPLTLTLDTDGGGKVTKSFRLCLDFNAISEIEERTGISLLRGDIWKHITANVLRVMLWASVLAHNPEFDTFDDEGKRTEDGLEAIGSYMDAGNTAQIAEGLWQAYLASLPEEKRKALTEAREKIEEKPESAGDAVPLASPPAPAATPAASDGSSSGASLATTSASA